MSKIEVISAIIGSGRKMTIGVKCVINIRKRSRWTFGQLIDGPTSAYLNTKLKVLVSVFDIRFFEPLPQNIIQNQTESANGLFIPKSAQIKTESTKQNSQMFHGIKDWPKNVKVHMDRLSVVDIICCHW